MGHLKTLIYESVSQGQLLSLNPFIWKSTPSPKILACRGNIGMVKQAKIKFQRVLGWVTLIFEIIIKRAALSQNGPQYHKTGHFFIYA